MKLKHLLLFGWAAVLAGCTDQADEVAGPDTPQEAIAIQIDGGINQQYISRVADGGFCGGDEIGLYGVNYTDKNTVAGTLLDAGNQVDNVRYTYSEESMGWTSSTPAYYKDVNTCIDLYAYYPYGTPLSTSAYEFEVAKDQQNNNGYAVSDFLWAKADSIVPSENRVKLHFTHRMACANVILQEGEGFEEGVFNKLEKSVLVMNTTRTAAIDLATGIVTATGEPTSEGTLMMESTDGFRAIVVPQTVEADNTLFAITVNGVSYRFKLGEAFEYQPAMQAQFTITVNYKEMTGDYEFVLTDTQIVEWIADPESHGGEARQYYVVKMEEPGTLGALIKADKKNPNKIKNLKISGNVNAGDFYFMRDSMEILQAVNMKECTIKASTRISCNINNEGFRHEYFDGIVSSSVDDVYQLLDEKYPNVTHSISYPFTYYYDDEIPSSAFSEKGSLVYFSFPEVVTKIGSSAFSKTLLSGALIIPNDVTEIGDNAFRETNVSSLTLPNGIETLGGYTFYQCSSLTGDLILPESLESIGVYCFYDSKYTGTLTIPSKLEKIATSCFYNCNFSGDLIIPDNVKEIGSSAFYSNSGLNGQLILPEGLMTIGSLAFSGCNFQGELILPNQMKTIESHTFSNCDFSRIVFPEELIMIESSAFSGNRVSELEFPENLFTIGERAFSGCTSLSKVTFPSKLQTIGNSAFSGCRNIASITSKAVTPPRLIGTPFYEVPRSIVVNVPAESIAVYSKKEDEWREFQYEKYYDFSIDHPLIRTLNASYTETSTLTCPDNYSWSIKSKPDWVTVTPESGTGTTEVTVTVDELAAGGETRTEQVVFQLDKKDYTAELSVEQYNYVSSTDSNDPIEDGDVVVEQETTQNSNGKGPNIVFIGDGFDAKDIHDGTYLQTIREAITHFFDVEPYKNYKSYFNIHIMIAMSPDRGLGTEHHHKRSKFGSKYTREDGIILDTDMVFDYVCKPGKKVHKDNLHETLIVVIENNSEYGSATYMWNDGSAISICPVSDGAYPYDFRGTIQHEAGGHGFGKLGDECVYTQGFIGNCSCSHLHEREFQHAKKYGWYANLSLSGDMNEVPWSHLMFHEDYKDIVDMYEGGYYHTNGVYRSEAISCMDNHIPYFSTVSREAIVKRIKKCAGEEFSQEEFYEKDVKGATQSRSIDYWTSGSDNKYRQYAPRFMGDKPKLK